ncbi:MAG: GntR family transcriptional regulator [Gemmatimonadales bacterium]
MTGTNGQRGDHPAAFVARWLGDVDGRSPIPLYDQIASRVRAAVGGGVLAAGDPLPSVRQLAAELRVNPATVVQAYRLLETEGLAEMRQGSGTFVRHPAPEQRVRQREKQARTLVRKLLEDGARLGVEPADLERAWNDLVEERGR